MISRTTKRFRDCLASLPAPARKKARQAYQQFRQNPRHPGLRFKKVHKTLPVYAARVGRDYRAVGVVEDDEIVWFWIGGHDEYERLLRTL